MKDEAAPAPEVALPNPEKPAEAEPDTPAKSAAVVAAGSPNPSAVIAPA